MHAHDLATREAHTVARAETMLVLAEVTGVVGLKALALVARQFEQRLGRLDTAEGPQRAKLESLLALDIAELADAYKRLRAATGRMPRA